MLPTKGYFQDIECPFYNTNCGRPYCHFRHRKRPNESADDGIQDPSKNVVPTYKPTPKSELENIHNSRSHIPISYVPDLAFKRDRTVRPVRIQTATYKPTPLSILSSTAKPESSLNEKNLYNPLESDINFEELTNEFDLIDNIIHDTEGAPEALNQLKANIEKEQDRLNLQLKVSKVVDDTTEPRFSSDEEKVEVCASKPESKSSIKLESEIKKEKPDSTTSCVPEKSDNGVSEKSSRKIKKEDEKSSNKKSKSKETDSRSSSHHKSSKRESHRKEEKKGSSKDRHSSTSRHKHKSPKPEKRHRHKSSSDSSSGLSSRDSTPDKGTKDNSKTSTKSKKESSSKSKSKSSSNTHDKKRKRSRSPSGESKGHERSDKKKKEDKEKSKNKSRSKDKLVDENKLRKHEKRHSKKPEKAGKLFF